MGATNRPAKVVQKAAFPVLYSLATNLSEQSN